MNEELIKKLWADKADIVVSSVKKYPPNQFYSTPKEKALRTYKILKEVFKS